MNAYQIPTQLTALQFTCNGENNIRIMPEHAKSDVGENIFCSIDIYFFQLQVTIP